MDNSFTSLRIGSYNVLCGERGTPLQLKDALSAFQFDILALCESPNGQWLEDTALLLGFPYYYIGEISTAGHENKYKAVLSKTPFIEKNEIWIQGSRWGHHCSTVKIVTTLQNTDIAVYSLHIPKSPDPDVTGVHFFVNEIITNEKTPISIYAGDFNTRIGSPTMKILEQAGLRNPWIDLQMDYKNLSSMERFVDEMPDGYVIDHILLKSEIPIKVVDGGIIELEPMLSDHKPVWVSLDIQNKKK